MISKTNKFTVLIASAFFAFAAFSTAEAATLTIAPKGEQLLFDKTSLSVKAGEKVKLTLKNTSGMQHNWVLVAPGTADKVAQESITAGDLDPKLEPGSERLFLRG